MTGWNRLNNAWNSWKMNGLKTKHFDRIAISVFLIWIVAAFLTGCQYYVIQDYNADDQTWRMIESDEIAWLCAKDAPMQFTCVRDPFSKVITAPPTDLRQATIGPQPVQP